MAQARLLWRLPNSPDEPFTRPAVRPDWHNQPSYLRYLRIEYNPMTVRPIRFYPRHRSHPPEGAPRPVRVERPAYVDLNAALATTPCPAGTKISRRGWILAQAGNDRPGLGRRSVADPNPLPAVHGRVLLSFRAKTGCNRTQIDSAVRHPCVERFLGDMATANGWTPPAPSAPDGQTCPHRRRRPERVVGGLASGAQRPRGRDPRCRPASRRHAAFRHSRLSPAAAPT